MGMLSVDFWAWGWEFSIERGVMRFHYGGIALVMDIKQDFPSKYWREGDAR